MNNISFSKNMKGYTQGDLVAKETIAEINNNNEIDVIESPNIISLEELLENISNLMYYVHLLYEQHAYKELYDVQMNLISAKKSLRTILK